MINNLIIVTEWLKCLYTLAFGNNNIKLCIARVFMLNRIINWHKVELCLGGVLDWSTFNNLFNVNSTMKIYTTYFGRAHLFTT